jgi:Zinc carboxypeptidase
MVLFPLKIEYDTIGHIRWERVTREQGRERLQTDLTEKCDLEKRKREAKRADIRLFLRIASLIFVILIVCPGSSPLFGQQADLSFLRTRAERSFYEETTRYDELIGFLEVATTQSPLLRLTSFGYTTEGRSLPLVIFGDLPGPSPEAVQASDKLVIYLQGNIHAGEVCGKEALLSLVRDLAAGEYSAWADSLVILVAPIYNADGNERINLFNRARQNGPFGGMGTRANSAGLDLNRDHMKVKSPEARSFVTLLNRYDPDVVVDFHTTNGTRHGYYLTYAPPLNPNTDSSIVNLLRNELLPEVTGRIREKYDWDYYYYGNLPYRRDAEMGWYTFDHRPRFNNNYVGLRNRVAILSEAYSYASFKDRIAASKYFAEEIVTYSFEHAGVIRGIVTSADSRNVTGDSLGVRARIKRNPQRSSILLGGAITRHNPYSGAPYLERQGPFRSEEMYEYGSFSSTERERVPAYYYIQDSADAIVGYLDIHGIEYSRLEKAESVETESFRIDSTRVSGRLFQDIRERTVYGSYRSANVVLPPGTVVVNMRQPLARLIFYLLEPRSDDGLLNWAQIDSFIEVGGDYPVRRSLN